MPRSARGCRPTGPEMHATAVRSILGVPGPGVTPGRAARRPRWWTSMPPPRRLTASAPEEAQNQPPGGPKIPSGKSLPKGPFVKILALPCGGALAGVRPGHPRGGSEPGAWACESSAKTLKLKVEQLTGVCKNECARTGTLGMRILGKIPRPLGPPGAPQRGLSISPVPWNATMNTTAMTRKRQ